MVGCYCTRPWPRRPMRSAAGACSSPGPVPWARARPAGGSRRPGARCATTRPWWCAMTRVATGPTPGPPGAAFTTRATATRASARPAPAGAGTCSVLCPCWRSTFSRKRPRIAPSPSAPPRPHRCSWMRCSRSRTPWNADSRRQRSTPCTASNWSPPKPWRGPSRPMNCRSA